MTYLHTIAFGSDLWGIVRACEFLDASKLNFQIGPGCFRLNDDTAAVIIKLMM